MKSLSTIAIAALSAAFLILGEATPSSAASTASKMGKMGKAGTAAKQTTPAVSGKAGWSGSSGPTRVGGTIKPTSKSLGGIITGVPIGDGKRVR